MNMLGVFTCAVALCGIDAAAQESAGRAKTGEYVFNGTFELGDIGRPTPWFGLLNRLNPSVVYDYPERNYAPVTVPGGVNGNCMQVPGVRGRAEYNLETHWFYLMRDGEVELSFDGKAGPDENGAYRDQRVIVDFRCYDLNSSAYASTSGRYPVLTGASFRPTQRWKRFNFRFKVKAGFPYTLWFRCHAKTADDLINALYFDNVSIMYVDEKDKVYHNEVYATLDRDLPAYQKNQPVTLAIRALIKSRRRKLELKLEVVDGHSKDVCRKDSVVLVRSRGYSGPEGDPRFLYEGTYSLVPPRFGCFHTRLSHTAIEVVGKGGEFSVIHPVVKHPRYSPGWSLGTGGGSRLSGYPLLKSASAALTNRNAKIDTYYRLISLAGLSIVRYWGHLSMIEGNRQALKEHLRKEFDLINGLGLDILYVVGGSLGRSTKPVGDTKVGTYVLHPSGRFYGLLPAAEVWESHLHFLLDNFADDITFWEIINEPQWRLSAENYMPLLKTAYALLKKHDPDAVVLGNGATSDGANALVWTEQLVKLNHERYLDVIAYHPYGAGLDSQKGTYFKASKRVEDLRERLETRKPLWSTECYYLVSDTIEQGTFLGQHKFAANDVQRHQLLLLMSKVTGGASIAVSSLRKWINSHDPTPIPAEPLAGLNALSFFLQDMVQLENISISKFLKIGVFADKHRRKGFGFIWDLRHNAATWVVPGRFRRSSAITFYDLFGNKLRMGKEHRLSLDPVFVKGDPGLIKELFRTSRFVAPDSLVVRARGFGTKMYLEVQNLTGSACRPELVFLGLPCVERVEACQFVFDENSFARKCLDLGAGTRAAGKKVSWQASIKGEELDNGTVDFLPAVGSHVLGYESAKRTFSLSKGTELSVWADETYLRVQVDVKDRRVVPAKDNSLWQGDALEVFIDANPFYRMDVDAITSGDEMMNVLQYAFAATPSRTGHTQRAFHKKRGEFETKSVCEREKTAAGYRLTASIPWDEIRPWFTIDDIFGIDFEIDHVDGRGRSSKESLGKKPGQCFRSRLHYPLFQIPPRVYQGYAARSQDLVGGGMVEDGDFESFAGWKKSSTAQRFIEHGARLGLNRTKGVKIQVPADQADAAAKYGTRIHQTISCEPGIGRAIVDCMVKMDNVRIVGNQENSDPRGGFHIKLHFYDGNKKKHMHNRGVGLSEYLVGTRGWKAYQFAVPVSGGATEITLSIGLAGGAAGTVWVDDVSFSYDNN